MKDIYDKILKGDPLTDEELARAHRYFTKLADMLQPLGDRFAFAYTEARYVRDRLFGFIIARTEGKA